MKLQFTKMHGCGNDYIYINCFTQTVEDPAALAVSLSRPHFGIGSDGVILICPSEIADAKMRMFNADGSEGKMCGNGIRCVGKYLYDGGKNRNYGGNAQRRENPPSDREGRENAVRPR